MHVRLIINFYKQWLNYFKKTPFYLLSIIIYIIADFRNIKFIIFEVGRRLKT